MSKICIDAGHGGARPGAVSGVNIEKNNTIFFAKNLKQHLENAGFVVYMTRDSDTDITIMNRCKYSNINNCDYFLSIHQNSFKNQNAYGSEIWINSHATNNTIDIARDIIDNVCTAGEFQNRGVKWGAPSCSDFGINKYTICPSALLEIGFITNENDMKKFNTNIDKICDGIVTALTKHFSAKKPAYKIGDCVKIIAPYASNIHSTRYHTYAIGARRYITAIYDGVENPYQLGLYRGNTSSTNTTGFTNDTGITK